MIRLLIAALLFTQFTAQVAAQAVSTYVRSQSGEARIEIYAARRARFRVPRTDFGTFLENIGKSMFGGVSAELLDNPSLERYPASLAVLRQRFSDPDFAKSSAMGLPLPWLPLRPNEGWRYEPRWGRAANSARYLYIMGLSGQEAGIRQTIYLPIGRERRYEGSMAASSQQGQQTLEVSFRRAGQPDALLASAKIVVPGSPGWHKLQFELVVPAGALAPLEPVDFAVTMVGSHRVSIDEILLYPADAIDGLDPSVIRAAKALHSPLLRFGGNFTSGYHWQDGAGPVDLRPTELNPAWGIPDYNLFGTDDLMKFCRLIGASPQICLNLGSGSAEEARKWVEYCQGSASSPEGKFRAQNGHAAPYEIAAWELGNELWGHFQIGYQDPQGYAARYHLFYGAIRSLVPQNTMIFANGADVDFFHDWNGAIIERNGPELHYLTSHFVVGMDDVVNNAAGRNSVWSADLAVPVGVGRALEPVEAQINQNPATRGRVKLAYTEWLFTAPRGSLFPRWNNLGGALVAAGWMNMLLEHADFVPVSDMTGLVEFAGIHKRRGRVFVTPQYWTLWLYSNFAGDSPVVTRTTVREYDVKNGVRRVPDIPNVPYLDVLATTDSHRGGITLFVVNRDWRRSIPAQIAMHHFHAAATAQVRTLTADSILTGNNEVHPERVRPVTNTLRVAGSEIHYAFPARSLTVITMDGK